MKKEQSIKQIIDRLRSSPYIHEKQFGDISSFNFTKKAFINSHWNDLTMRARGLFINTRTNEIVTRGYDKFFNVDERPNTRLNFMERHMNFPVNAYRKENGFLGLISYNKATDDLLFASKSMIGGEYADNLKRIFMNSGLNVGRIKNALKVGNITLAVEVIDPVNDPHIIEYPHEKIVLLDMIKNTWDFEKYDHVFTSIFARYVNMQCKKRMYSLMNSREITDFVTDCLNDTVTEIEGYVLEDNKGVMVKVKTAYYRTWKQYRWKAQKMLHDGCCEETDPFLKWIYRRFVSGESLETKGIIDLRNEYRRTTDEHNG